MSTKAQAGVTLVELIVALVIVASATAGLLAAFNSTRINTDPVIEKQMAAVAEGLMEEVLLKPFASANAPGSTRGNYQDVDDFRLYTGNLTASAAAIPITDASGNAIAALAGYRVGVRVEDAALTGIAATDARRITVQVWHGADSFALTGWRTRP
ncbi:MAG: prepilin-type N-terminal cleavage/methylation domain-containing protein [Gammaproteobacteria bacterium]